MRSRVSRLLRRWGLSGSLVGAEGASRPSRTSSYGLSRPQRRALLEQQFVGNYDLVAPPRTRRADHRGASWMHGCLDYPPRTETERSLVPRWQSLDTGTLFWQVSAVRLLGDARRSHPPQPWAGAVCQLRGALSAPFLKKRWQLVRGTRVPRDVLEVWRPRLRRACPDLSRRFEPRRIVDRACLQEGDFRHRLDRAE